MIASVRQLSFKRFQYACRVSFCNFYSTKVIKKFYKKVSITKANGGYEINLDQRKLKTPLGNTFAVPSEALALGVATEWESQGETIKRHAMHLTSLSNTAIDNPSRRSRNTVLNGILEYLDTDTILYRLEDPPELAEVLSKSWDPLITWVRWKYEVELAVTSGLGVPGISAETRDVFWKHLQIYNDWALVGYQQAVENLKSIIITAALMDRAMSVERALELSRLEIEYQTQKWGNVEWHHDVELMALRSRIASAVLFVHLNSEDIQTVFKKSDSKQPFV